MVKDKDNILVENKLFSGVIGCVRLYETPPKMIINNKKELVKNISTKT